MSASAEIDLVRLLLFVVMALGGAVAALAAYIAKQHAERVKELRDDREADRELAEALRALAGLEKGPAEEPKQPEGEAS